MKAALKKILNYYFYCGIDKDEYNSLKKGAYISNYKVWRILHILMAIVFAVLFVGSLIDSPLSVNKSFYLIALVYSVIAMFALFVLRDDSIAAQLLIYLSISFLFLFGCFITQNKPDRNATTFIVLLLITPMFMIDKPFFMTIELCTASTVFLIWMHAVKPYEVWEYDLINVVTFTVVGCFLNIIANSIRIKEFVLTKEINIQKDTDEMTGLMNKSSLTREINAFLKDKSSDKGILFVLDVDRFKSINDTYGHDVGDRVITDLGHYLKSRFNSDELSGRFGGDEFIVFIKNTDSADEACRIAEEIVKEVSDIVRLPDDDNKIDISIGISVYAGVENNYSELFKKADIALYKAKADKINRYCVYG